jgi:hypothetical protein
VFLGTLTVSTGADTLIEANAKRSHTRPCAFTQEDTMHARGALHMLTATVIAGALAACTKDASSATNKNAATQASASVAGGDAASASDWTANGATACERYLTPSVVAEILVDPAGHTHRLTAQSCEYATAHSGNIGITLKVTSASAFQQQMKRIAGANLMTGVGDAAYWNQACALSSVKGNRGCDIEAFGVAFHATKLSGEALGKQLGAICAKLFALP